MSQRLLHCWAAHVDSISVASTACSFARPKTGRHPVIITSCPNVLLLRYPATLALELSVKICLRPSRSSSKSNTDFPHRLTICRYLTLRNLAYVQCTLKNLSISVLSSSLYSTRQLMSLELFSGAPFPLHAPLKGQYRVGSLNGAQSTMNYLLRHSLL